MLPHLQNTGGFFIAVLQKTAELPWVAARTIKKTTDGRLKYYNFQDNRIITLFRPMEFSIKFDTVRQECILYILRGHRLYFPNNIIFLSLKIYYTFGNSADPDEMPHHAALQLNLHCLLKNPLRSLRSTKG